MSKRTKAVVAAVVLLVAATVNWVFFLVALDRTTARVAPGGGLKARFHSQVLDAEFEVTPARAR